MRTYGIANSTQDLSLTWDERAQNVILKYNQTRTFSTTLLVEIINLIKDVTAGAIIIDPGNGGGSDDDNNAEPLPWDITAEEIRDKLQELSGSERLDAAYIKNISQNVFVTVDGSQMPLQQFLELLFTYIVEDVALTREDVINLIGFEPFDNSNVVHDIQNPSNDTVISTAGLSVILQDINLRKYVVNFGDGVTTAFVFNHELQSTDLTYEIFQGNNRVFASATSITSTTISFSFIIPPINYKLIVRK